LNKTDRAKHLLMDDFFMDEIRAMQESYRQTIEHSRPEDYDIRESAYRSLRTVNEIVSHFESLAAQKEIDKRRLRIF
jgi:hypothetical protein